MSKQPFPTVRAFIEHVGRSDFEKTLGHTPQVVSRAITQNIMPAHWYFDVRDWCHEKGVVVPEHLFRRSHRPVNAGAPKQDANCLAQGQ